MCRPQVLIVATHSAFRGVLRDLLSGAPDIDIVGEVANTADLARTLERLAPQVVLVDINLAGGSGLSVSREVSHHLLSTHVVILIEEDSRTYRQALLDAGANALVRKASIAQLLIPCIRKLVGEEVVEDVG